MTLVKGDNLIKLDQNGEPMTTEQQSYIEWKIEELSPSFSRTGVPVPAGAAMQELGFQIPTEGEYDDVYQLVLLRKVH